MMEKEQIEKALRGYYRTGCFHIYLTGSFDKVLTKMSQEDLGTFLHEYVHYMQNISTPYGIFEAVALNEAAVEAFVDIQPKTEIELPYDAPQSELLKERLKWLNTMNGQSVSNQDYLIEVDDDKEILMGRMDISFAWREGQLIILEYYDKIGNVHRRVIGALDIKEAMAVAYQSLIDPDAKHPDIPYNLLRIFCKQYFPTIGSDAKRFICLCYTSLFSLEPAYHFVQLCYQAENKKGQSSFMLFDEYMNNHSVTVQGKRMKPWEHFNHLLEQYGESIRGLLRCDTPYIDEILNRVKLINGNVPLLNVINSEAPFTVRNVKALVEALGIPYMHAQGRGWFFPSMNGKGASDVVKLVGTTLLYRFLVEKNKSKMCVCPLVSMCGQEGTYCYDQPWLERDCPFELIGEEIGLKDKKIIVN